MNTSTSVTSCMECPNFVRSTKNGHSIGGCAEEGKVVFIGGISPVDHLARLAQSCPSAGEETPIKPQWYSAIEATAPDFTSHQLSTCRGCEHFIPAPDPSVPSGLNVCGAHGGFIDPETDYHGCPFAKEGIPSAPAKPLLELVTDASALSSGAAGAARVVARAKSEARRKPFVDPSVYPTDLPVSEEDKGVIRAWRRVEAGVGEKRQEFFLPIFEPEYFHAGERELIPQTNSDDHPELYHDGSGLLEAFVVDVWQNDEPLCLVGEPGVGKTEGARWLAWLMQMPFTHLQVTEETLPDEFLGRTAFSPEIGTHFVWGRLPRAIARPGVVLSDEINTGADSILQTYRSLNSAGATIYLDGEEDATKHVVRRHAHCFHLLALNPTWDARNLGTRELADADVSRLSFFWMEEPDDKTLMQIILDKLESEQVSISNEELVGMLQVRKDIKEASRSGALPFSWSIRQDVKVAKKMAFYDPVTAYRRALLDYVHPDAAEVVLGAVRSVFGYDS